MQEVIEYLEMKNHYYEKFFTVTSKLVSLASQNQWKELEFFVDSRDRILAILRSFDHKIEAAMEKYEKNESLLAQYRDKVKALFAKRQAWADKILQQDLKLISVIDDFKTETIRELKDALSKQQGLDSFSRSTPSPRKFVKVAKA